MLKHAFVKGLKEKYTEQGVEAKIEQLDICKMQIGSCKGCFVCWKVTPGQLLSVKELSSRTGALYNKKVMTERTEC